MQRVFAFLVLVVGLGAASAWGGEIGTGENLSELVLLRSTQGKAVVRFGTGGLVIISVGDRLGRNGAEVKEIVPGRVVLEEAFIGKDGRPNRAQIILKEGEKGGTRYLARPEEEPPPAARPLVIFPQEQEKKQ